MMVEKIRTNLYFITVKHHGTFQNHRKTQKIKNYGYLGIYYNISFCKNQICLFFIIQK